MRFLADMGVSTRIVEWPRHQNHEALHLRDEGLYRMPDTEIFDKALSEQRIVITFDLDFGEIAALAKRRVISVILFRLHNTRTSHVIERLSAVLTDSKEALQQGAVVVVEESRHRIRYLPIGHV